MKLIWQLFSVALIVGSTASTSWAQATDDHTLEVAVPSVLTITAPVAALSENHAATDADFSLTTQQWVANCNSVAGATIIFTLEQPFIHTTAPTYKRDARMTVALDSGASDAAAAWVVAAPVAVATDYDLGVPLNSVTVAAASTAPGIATFDISVDFLTEDYSTLPNGTYTTSVSATITAN